MKPIIKPLENKNIEKTENITYAIKGTQQMPNEVKKLLTSMSVIFKMELISYLTKVNAYLKTGKGSKQELAMDCQKYINILRLKKGNTNGSINRNIGTRSPLTRRMDGVKKR